jgi:hypothetical protein
MRMRFLGLFLLAAALFASAPLVRADENSVHFFDDIHIPAGAAAHDAVCFFCGVNADGEINGNLVVFFGHIHLASAAHHDVVAFFSTVKADDNASIENNLVTFFSSVRLGSNVSVGHDMVSMFSSVHAADSVSIHGHNVLFPFWIFAVPMLLIIAIVVGIVREIRARMYHAYGANYPYPPRM